MSLARRRTLAAPVRTGARAEALYLASLSESSRPTMISSLDIVARHFGASSRNALPWAELRYEHLVQLRTWLGEEYAPATGNRILAAVRGVLREAMRLELLSDADYRRALELRPIPGSRVPAGRALTMGELRALFAAAQREGPSLAARDAAILALLYGAGLRRHEAVGLDLEHVDGRALTVLGKGNKQRVVYLPPGGVLAVDAWIALRGREPGPLLYPTRGGRGARLVLERRRLSTDAILGAVERLAELAGVAHCSPHDFRRSFVSDLLDAGADLVAVQQLAGHSHPTTTARYDRRGERAKSRAVDLISVPYG